MENLHRVVIKIGDLFQKLGIDNDKHEELQEVEGNFYVKTPKLNKHKLSRHGMSFGELSDAVGEYTRINGFVKKLNVEKRKVNLEDGTSFVCASNHRVLAGTKDCDQGYNDFENSEDVEYLGKNYRLYGSPTIKDLVGKSILNNIKDLYVPIKSLGFPTMGDVYDISLDGLPYYQTPNGIIHHNTTVAKCIANDLGSDSIYINGSLNNSIDDIRYRVSKFATTYSLKGQGVKKVVILDECERMTAAQEALKVLIEETEKNCRYILLTNNYSKIIDPLQSRCEHIPFRYAKGELQYMAERYFKRIKFILDNEGVEYDDKTVAEFIKKMFPDLRRTITKLSNFSKSHGKITEGVLALTDGDLVDNFFDALKSGDVKQIRKLCSQVEPTTFYTEFYNKAAKRPDVNPKKLPKMILTLGQFGYQHSSCIDPEINLAACAITLVQDQLFKP